MRNYVYNILMYLGQFIRIKITITWQVLRLDLLEFGFGQYPTETSRVSFTLA